MYSVAEVGTHIFYSLHAMAIHAFHNDPLRFHFGYTLSAQNRDNAKKSLGAHHGEIINMERPRGVNCVKTAGGRTLCTLDRGKGLYG